MEISSTATLSTPPLQDANNTPDQSENSPEAAGLARGAARSAARTARISERFSTGLNAYEAATNAGVVESAKSAKANAAKSAAKTLSKRFMIGRLPKSTPAGVGKVASKMPKSYVPRGGVRVGGGGSFRAQPMKIPGRMPKTLRLRRVAKASDRLSTGFDVFDAASSVGESNERSTKNTLSPKNGSKKEQPGMQLIQNRLRPFFAFSGTLLKNTFLGAAAFGSYEKVIAFLDEHNKEIEHNSNNNILSNDGIPRETFLYEDAFARTSIMQHTGAGACAGAAHGSLSVLFDSSFYLYKQRSTLRNALYKQPVRSSVMQQFINQSIPWSFAYTLHHTIAHAVLFSSYEWTKRTLFGQHKKEDRIETNVDGNNIQSMFWNGDVLIIGIAGGIAGKCQHVVSHYTEQIFHVGENQTWNNDQKVLKDNKEPFKAFKQTVRKRSLIAPTLRSIIISFFPSAVGFIAFEFGKEIVNS